MCVYLLRRRKRSPNKQFGAHYKARILLHEQRGIKRSHLQIGVVPQSVLDQPQRAAYRHSSAARDSPPHLNAAQSKTAPSWGVFWSAQLATATKTDDQETAAPETSDSPVLDLLDAAVM